MVEVQWRNGVFLPFWRCARQARARQLLAHKLLIILRKWVFLYFSITYRIEFFLLATLSICFYCFLW